MKFEKKEPKKEVILYKIDVSMVGKLAMFGDRIMRSKANEVEKEFVKNLQEKLKSV